MNLIIDGQRYVKPVKQGGWITGETWFNYYVYSVSDLKRIFRGYCLRDVLMDVFSYGSGGPGCAYSRRLAFD